MTHIDSQRLAIRDRSEAGTRICARSPRRRGAHDGPAPPAESIGDARGLARAERMTNDGESHRVLEWLFNDRTTTASRAMAARLAGIELRNPYDRACHPQDPAEFRLCLDVLVRMPEWRDRLDELRSLSPAWAALVGGWNGIVKSIERETASGGESARRLPLTYALMKGLGL